MHADTFDTDENFFNALTLLHSTEEDSTEKLRLMLDACIEKRYGPDKTLAARMPRRFLGNVNDSNLSTRTSKRRDYAQERNTTNNEIRDVTETISLLETDVAENIASHRTTDVKIFEINYEDCCEDDEDVPRISIPDEGSADGTVCKICNGAKLGPLILLECQECQEAYHPLCHQPPIIDVDVYDPRFVWRCRRCVETSSMISTRITIMETGPPEKIRRNHDTVKENANISGLKMLGNRNGLPVESRSAQLRDSPLFAKDLTNLSQRNGGLSSSTQSRKRIGSKLSVTRTSVK